MVIFVIPWQAEKNELLKDDEDEIEEEERKKRKRGEQLEKEREERLKHLSEWKVMHHSDCHLSVSYLRILYPSLCGQYLDAVWK